jgi:hypothetical protein
LVEERLPSKFIINKFCKSGIFMGILQKLLKEVVTPNIELTQQVKELCDLITEEEKENIKYPKLLPSGPNVFLSLEVPGRYNTEVGFITLEREGEEEYIIVYHTLEKYRIDKNFSIPPRRRKVWEINENKAEKILTKFALIIKFLRNK